MNSRSSNGTTTDLIGTTDISESRRSVPITVADGAWHCDPSDQSPRRGRSPLANLCILTAIFILTPPWFLLVKEIDAEFKLSPPRSELWQGNEESLFIPLEKELFAEDALRTRLRERRSSELSREKSGAPGYLHFSREFQSGAQAYDRAQLEADAEKIASFSSPMDLAPLARTSWWTRLRTQHLTLIICTFLAAGLATLMPFSTSTGARIGMAMESVGTCLLYFLPAHPWLGFVVLGVGAEGLFDALTLWVCRLPDAPLMLSLLGAARLASLVAWFAVTRALNSTSLLVAALIGVAIVKLLLLIIARLPHKTDLDPPGTGEFDVVEVWLDFLTHMVPLMVMSVSLLVLSVSLIVSSSSDSIAVAAIQCAASCLSLPLLVCGQVAVIADQQLPGASCASDVRNRNLIIRLIIVCTRCAASLACVLVLLMEHATLPASSSYGSSGGNESLLAFIMSALTQLHRTC